MRDFQRSKVYKWEHKFFGFHDKTLNTAKIFDFMAMAYKITRQYNCDPVIVEENYRWKKTLGKANAFKITLRANHLKMYIFLHEMAHVINKQKLGLADDAHGENFMVIYNDLTTRYMDMDKDELRQTQKIADVRFNYYLPFELNDTRLSAAINTTTR